MAVPPDSGRLRRLQSLTDAALAHLELEPLLGALLERARDVLQADTCAILLLDADTNELVTRAAVGREASVASQVEVPLVAAGHALGVLRVGTLQLRNFEQEDTELLQLAADRAAIAIDHARLFEAEQAARIRVERVQAVTDAALAHLDVDDLLAVLLPMIRDVLRADTCAVLLLDEDTGELVARSAVGIEEEVTAGVRIPVGGGFAGVVAATKAPVVLPEID
ncbi:MAG TPA: GAF domain-containing protein, partial [Gaiellaceae bacterium]